MKVVTQGSGHNLHLLDPPDPWLMHCLVKDSWTQHWLTEFFSCQCQCWESKKGTVKTRIEDTNSLFYFLFLSYLCLPDPGLIVNNFLLNDRLSMRKKLKHHQWIGERKVLQQLWKDECWIVLPSLLIQQWEVKICSSIPWVQIKSRSIMKCY